MAESAKTFLLHISTMEDEFYSGPVESLVMRAQDGDIGVLPGHLSMVVGLVTGPLRFMVEGEWRVAAVSGGFARIREDRVVVFTDTADWPEDIDERAALEEKKQAQERLQNKMSSVEYMETRVALDRALTRLQVKTGEPKFM